MGFWYRTGTVALVQNSDAVVGTLTAFLAGARVGDMLVVDGDDRVYEITSVTANTQLTISPAYAGATASGKTYRIAPFSAKRSLTADLGVQVSALIESIQGGRTLHTVNGVPLLGLGIDGDYAYNPATQIWYGPKLAGAWGAGIFIKGAEGDPGPPPQITGTSITSLVIGTGAKTFATQADRQWVLGQRLSAASDDGTLVMEGVVTAYAGTSLTLEISTVIGSGTHADWNISITGGPGPEAQVTGTSVTSLAIGTGAKIFTTQAGRQWVLGQRLRAASDDGTLRMEGVVTAYATTQLTLNVDRIAGSGSHADWNIGIAGQPGTDGAGSVDSVDGQTGVVVTEKQTPVISATLTAPPGSPANGNRHIIASPATGAWAGRENQIAEYRSGAWAYFTPTEGWRVWVQAVDLIYHFSGTAWAALPAASTGLPPGHWTRLTLSNNAGNPNNGVDISTGKARDLADTMDLVVSATLTKLLSAVWAVGSGNGGLDTGVKANSTWYFVWLIGRLDTSVTDMLFSLSATSPTMPAGYTANWPAGAVQTDASGNIQPYVQVGDFVYWTANSTKDVNAASQGTASVARTLKVPPVLGIEALINVSIFSATAGAAIDVRPGMVADFSYTPGHGNLACTAANIAAAALYRRQVNGLGQIKAATNIAAVTLDILTSGYIWNPRRFL